MQLKQQAWALFNEMQEKLVGDGATNAMVDLAVGLKELRQSTTPDEWNPFAQHECLKHPIRKIVHLDPLTRRAFEKPRGYAGDAELMDMIYGNAKLPEDISETAAAIYRWARQSPCSAGVRARRDILAATVDQVASEIDSPKILSIACGHLREAQCSKAVAEGRVGEYLALDHDPISLAVIEQEQSHRGIEPVNGSVRSLITGRTKLSGFDFVYAAGLYDYLTLPVASKLTALMFTMLNSGGRLLVPNFVPEFRDIAYMETFMAWRLIYRDEEQMQEIMGGIPSAEVRDWRLFREDNNNIVFLEIYKK